VRCLLVNTGLRVDLNDVARIRRSVEDVMSMLASHPSPNFGPDAPVPSGIDLGDGGSVQIPRGGGPGDEDPELSCICCLVPVEQDPEPTDPDGGGRGGEGRSLTCCSDGVCDDGDPCTVNDRCGGPYGLGCLEGDCCGEGLRCPRGKCDRRAYCAGGVCVQEPKDCDDGSACTTDWCDGDTGCEHRWCASRDCFIAHCVDDHCEYEERICPGRRNRSHTGTTRPVTTREPVPSSSSPEGL